MAEKVFLEANGKFLPAIALAMSETAFLLLVELAKQRGPGPWLDKIRSDLETEMKNTIIAGMPMADEPGSVEAAIGAVRFVFDRITWTTKPNPPAV